MIIDKKNMVRPQIGDHLLNESGERVAVVVERVRRDPEGSVRVQWKGEDHTYLLMNAVSWERMIHSNNVRFEREDNDVQNG